MLFLLHRRRRLAFREWKNLLASGMQIAIDVQGECLGGNDCSMRHLSSIQIEYSTIVHLCMSPLGETILQKAKDFHKMSNKPKHSCLSQTLRNRFQPHRPCLPRAYRYNSRHDSRSLTYLQPSQIYMTNFTPLSRPPSRCCCGTYEVTPYTLSVKAFAASAEWSVRVNPAGDKGPLPRDLGDKKSPRTSHH